MARKRKDEGGTPDKEQEVLPAARFVAPLRKPADVTMERKRLYRAVLNGRVPIEDAAKLSYMLNGIRADLEADAPPQIEHAPGGYVVDTVIINGVPSGTYLPMGEIQRLESQFAPPPLSPVTGPPMLKVYDNVDDEDSEQPPPQAA